MTAEPQSTTELLDLVDEAWHALQLTVAPLTAREMAKPGAGGWSIKDHLAHLANWEQWLLRYHLDGEPAHQVLGIEAEGSELLDYQAINTLVQQRSAARTVADVWAQWMRSHRQVRERLAERSFESLMTPRFADDPERRPLLNWVIGNTYDHYQEHGETVALLAKAARSRGRHVLIGDTRLYIVERGEGFPLMILHGGPGLDHHMFGDYLDELADELCLIFVDQRSQGLSDPSPRDTWTLKQMAADVTALARSLDLERYAVLGHSYGAFVTLQHAVDFPGDPAMSIVSSGLPSAHFLAAVTQNLDAFQPESLRAQVTGSWERERFARTQEDVASIMEDQWPFHFANPLDPRIEEAKRRMAGATYAPDVLRHFASAEYGGIEVEDRLAEITHPVLVLAGRHDRTCTVEGAQAIAAGIPDARLVVFEQSGHMTFVEENRRYVDVVREALL